MIRPNNFERQWTDIGPKVLAAVERVGSSGRYILGSEVERFEKALAEYCGVTHAVGVGNGLDALEISLRCLGLRAGQRVLTTPFSAFATTLAILRVGGIPVFADVDDSGNLDLDQAREILAADRSIRFLLPVHLYGNPLDLEKLARLKQDFHLMVVEDCAQAIGAKHGGRAVGTVGQAAGTSFYPTKNLGALGDAGAVLTDDHEVAAKARMLRNYGQTALYQHDEIGLNSRIDELQAAILTDALLPCLAEWTEKRRSIATRYVEEIRNPSVRTLQPMDGSQPVWHIFPLFAKNQEALALYLGQSQIQTLVHYPRIIPEQKACKEARYEIAADPVNARKLAATEISLPIHPFLEEAEIAEIIRAVNGFHS